jgi:FAD binding domain/Berberine and berberine like
MSVMEIAVAEKLNARVRGQLLLPGEDGYDTARKIFNAMIDKRPAMILRSAGAADVVEAVNFAREHEMLVSIRSGGHGIAGKAICDGGLMIDLSRMKGIRVNPTDRTVRAEPGLMLGEFDRETQTFGLATTLGVASTTGIAGLTLGGGLGWLMGKYGLACDNLISADLVTADGHLLQASADQNADLFWGIRGGGGNFGIVTSLEYRLHSVGPVILGGAVLYPLARAKEFLRFFREFATGTPDEVSMQGGMFTFNGTPVVGMAACYCGPIDEGEKVLKPLRAFGSPVADLFNPMPYIQMQSMFDSFFPPGKLHYWKSNFLQSLSDDAIETFVHFAEKTPSPQTFVWFPGEHLHGAAARVGLAESAFAHRSHPYNFSIFSVWSDPSDTEKNVVWTRAFWNAMQPFMAAGTYVNYLEDEGDPRTRDAYGLGYERLVALKNKYDPTNFFRQNQNIKPTVSGPTT